MSKTLRRLARDEGGQVLILVLVFVVVGALIMVPTLSLMNTGMRSGARTEARTDQLYGADAGVERALWWLDNNSPSIYPGPTTPPVELTPLLEVNGSKVFAFIEYQGQIGTDNIYRITSVAGPNVIQDTNLANQPQPYTKTVAYARDTTADFGGITQHVITSQGDYRIQGGGSSIEPPEGEENGPQTNYNGPWPTPSYLSAFYWESVRYTTPYATDFLAVEDYPTGIGPLYHDGPLDIENGTAGVPTLRLNGTLYVTGDTVIGQTGQDFILDLNGQTIYVESATAGNQYALRIGGKARLVGTGCIIAVGNLELKPNMVAADPSNYVLAMSVTGKTYMQPNGTFYGTLAGSAEVNLQNGSIYWTGDTLGGGGSGSLNLPGPEVGVMWSVSGWNINRY